MAKTKTTTKPRTTRPRKAQAGKGAVQTIKINRDHMISEAAYYLAEKRNFDGGDPLQDWLQAEMEIDQKMDSRQSV